uniref:NADH dehydrogenase subunit 2 n=1 Tax=Tetrameres grusi TaxID=1911024 RepID=UPI001FCD97FB|nr:NADH dehydrogenase subunit 2 [Tetrameres grusi]UNY39756.1 NADH dehydrogenase subunit 2 [Tetrameres grusi]
MMLFMGYLNLCLIDYVVWWSVFVVCTFIFLFVAKDSVFYGGLVNYYVLQELCGYYFLVFNNWKIQFLVLALKVGCAPVHFWLFSVVECLNKWFVMWFLVLQKLPYLFVMINFCSDFFFFFLFFGMVICYLQFFLVRSVLSMLVIGSTESFSWLLFLSMFSFGEIFFFFFFYYFVMFCVVMYFFAGGRGVLNFELVFVFMNIPLSVTFLLKVFLLVSSVGVGLYYLFLLLFLSVFSLGFCYWLFCLCMFVDGGVKYYDCYFFILLVFMVVSFL